MVMAGQYLERPAVVAAGDLTLEGLYHRGTRRPAVLVCPAPGPGGGMDAAPVAELAWAAARAGLPSLRFQYRGVGASAGEVDPERAVEDAEAALRHLVDTVGPRIAVAALGAGAGVALALAEAHLEIERVVLVAPAGPVRPSARARVLALVPAQSASGADALRSALGQESRVEVVDGADAWFRARLPQVGRLAVEWVAAR